MQGIEVAGTDRGGAVTYHGPGQLVAYPIVDLGRWGDDVHAYVRRLEEVMIGALGEHGVEAQVFEGLTGRLDRGPAAARRSASPAPRARRSGPRDGPGRARRGRPARSARSAST